jgi:glycosyltransferase involved in cell wall biosynthesis
VVRPYFFAVSCNETRKNTPLLIRAFLRYVLAGGKLDLKLAWHLPEALTAEVERAGLAPRVQALGGVSDRALLELYQGATCVMFPSLYEGFGFPVLEALACGVPVLTTRRSSLPEVGGELALYVDGGNVDEIVLQMFAFERGQHAQLAARCAVEGPEWAARFRWRDCAERTVQVYREAVAEIGRNWQPLDLRPAA